MFWASQTAARVSKKESEQAAEQKCDEDVRSGPSFIAEAFPTRPL
jgi:hypothetical protein